MKKIDPEVREAIIKAANQRMQGILVDEVLDRAEEILNRPKYSRLCEKVCLRLQNMGARLPDNYFNPTKDDINKALEGICELPEKATSKMAADFHYSPEPGHMPSLQLIFDNIRKGNYAPK